VRPYAVVVLAGLLLGAPGAVAADSCACYGRAVCINEDAGADLAAALRLPVTLELQSGGTNKQVSDELSRITGKRIAVLPSKPDGPVNLDIKRASLWAVLDMFYEIGPVQIEGRDFSELEAVRKALMRGETVSVCINRAPLGRVVADLSILSGKSLRVASGDKAAPVTLSSEAITLSGIISELSAQTGAQIRVKQ
jgi:hypothetical protein